MKIDKAWDFNVDQTIQILDKIYNVHACIRKAADFPILELEIDTMNISYSRPNNEHSLRNFVEHMRSVMDADLDYPIILNEDGCIIDGRHRLCKAMYLGLKTIKAKRFPKDDCACFRWEIE